MRPFVLKAVAKFPEENSSSIAGRLRRKAQFAIDFPQSRRTIEGDVEAIMKSGISE